MSLSNSGTISILPLEHQLEAMDRLAGKLDRTLLAHQSAAVYQDVSNELALMRRMFVDASGAIREAGGKEDRCLNAISQVDRLKTIVDHLFSIAVPAGAGCVPPPRDTEVG